MNALQTNIDDVRDEIMRLESAPHFNADAWSRVLADLSTAGRFSALADTQRRMETARSNQPAVGLDIATGQDKTVVYIVIETGELEIIMTKQVATKPVAVETGVEG